MKEFLEGRLRQLEQAQQQCQTTYAANMQAAATAQSNMQQINGAISEVKYLMEMNQKQQMEAAAARPAVDPLSLNGISHPAENAADTSQPSLG